MDLLRALPIAALCVLSLILSESPASPASARLRALSTDGEATVYLPFDFSRPFDLAYRVSFSPLPKNASWSLVSLLLLAGRAPSAAISVGLSRGFPSAALAAFTTSSRTGSAAKFTSFALTCVRACVVELRGDGRALTALAGGRVVGTWSRRSLAMARPSVQINAEVSAAGDALAARLVPVRAIVDGVARKPACGFTTQGIEPRADATGAIEFSGRRSLTARVTYLALPSGASQDHCPRS